MSSGEAGDWEFIWQNLSDGMARNPARDFRFKEILKRVPSNQGLKILDFGCGTGNLLSILSSNFPNNVYFGVDTSAEAIQATHRLCPNAQTGLITLDLEVPQIPWPNDFFDVIICSEVLEHIQNDVQTIKVLSQLLFEEGLLIATVPAGPMSEFDKFIGHTRHYSRDALATSLRAGGFVNIEIQRSGFPAMNFTRLYCLIMGKRLINLLSKENFGSTGGSGLLVILLRFLFRFARNDTLLGWQLISSSRKKINKPDEIS